MERPIDSTPNAPQQAAPSDPTPTPPESERLLAVRYWANVKDVTGTGAESLAWPELAPKLTTHTELQRKPDGTLWSPTLYRLDSNGKPLEREAVNVAALSCLVLDFDDGTHWEHLAEAWRRLGLEFVIHTSHSHTEAKPKWRAVFPLTRDVAGAEWKRRYAVLAAGLGDGHTDPQCSALSQMYYLPSCPPGAERFAIVNPGRFLDPEEFGTGSPVPTPAPAPAPARRQTLSAEDRAWILNRAIATSQAAAHISRNRACFDMACQLRDCGWSEGEACSVAEEFAAWCPQPADKKPFNEQEARRCVRSAFLRAPREPWSVSQPITLPPRASGTDQAAAPDPEQLKAAAAELENDIGNGKRFARFHAADVRHTPSLGWLVWDGRRWIPDEVAVAEAAKATALRIFHEVPHLAAADREAAARRGKWAKQSGDRNRLRGMRECAESDPTIAARREAFDTDLWLLNCLNGTLDLRTGTLRPPRREDLITRICPVEFDPAARCDPWERFLAETTGGDRDLADFLALAVGSSLTGWADDEVYFFVHGPTNSGKGTFVEAIRTILGEYGEAADFETFLLRKDLGAPRPDLVKLVGKRFVVAQEAEEGSTLAAARMKTMMGRDAQVVRDLYKPPFTFIPQWSIWLVANYRPKAPADDDAFWRRVVEVPFSHTVPKEQRDKTVKTRLTDPALAGPAILAWAVRGCLAWQANGLRIPEVVTRATTAYRESQDLVGRFLNDCCELHPHSWTSSGALKTAFDAWARDNRERTLSAKALATRFQQHGLEMKQAGVARTRGFAGVELVETEGLTLFGGDQRPQNGGNEHMNGCTPDSGILQRIISHEGTLPESGVHPFHVFTHPTAEAHIEDFA